MYRILTISLLLIHALNAYCQTGKFEIGLEAGPNMEFRAFSPTLSHIYPQIDNFQSTLGISTATSFQYKFHRNLSIRIGLGLQTTRFYYLNQTYSLSSGTELPVTLEQLGKFDTKLSLNAFTLPAVLKVQFGKSVKFYLTAGTQFSLNTSSSVAFNTDYPDNSPEISQNLIARSSHYYDFSFGAVTGIGLQFPIHERFNFTLEARNYTSLIRYNHFRSLLHNYTNNITFVSTLQFGLNYCFK